ncbi:unnamed protein product, partial [marine sediment metagenome]
VPQLKVILKSRGLKVSGRKSELINRILGVGSPGPTQGSPRGRKSPAMAAPTTMPRSNALAGMNIAITGALWMKRNDIISLIEANGGRFSKSITRSVTHLVAADPDANTSKLNKARTAGTQVVGENFLRRLMAANSPVNQPIVNQVVNNKPMMEIPQMPAITGLATGLPVVPGLVPTGLTGLPTVPGVVPTVQTNLPTKIPSIPLPGMVSPLAQVLPGLPTGLPVQTVVKSPILSPMPPLPGMVKAQLPGLPTVKSPVLSPMPLLPGLPTVQAVQSPLLSPMVPLPTVQPVQTVKSPLQ